MRLIPYILYLFLISFHQTLLSDLTSIYGVSFNMTILIVSLIAIYKEESTAVWFALCAGIVGGTLLLGIMPWQMLTLGILALLTSQLGKRINLDSIASRMVLLGGVVLIYLLVMTFLISSEDFLFMILRTILPGTIYTLLIGWLFFLVKDGHITWTKIKSLF